MASKGLAALSRTARDALGRGCGKEGSGALPLPRAAVISTRLRVRSVEGEHDAREQHRADDDEEESGLLR